MYREGGRLRTTRVVRTKGEARRLVNAELARIELGEQYRAPITLAELAERFLAQHNAAPQTIKLIRQRLVRPLVAFGDAQAADITTEALQRFVIGLPVGPAFKHDITRALRAVYTFGIRARLVDRNPALEVNAPEPVRGEKILPFESWAEVERVAEEAGRWGALIMFAVDCGARPAELAALEHRHVEGSVVRLPGTKNERARRTVHLTERGVEAYRSFPRAISTPLVFHSEGRPLSWAWWRPKVWYEALALADMAKRSPYQMRHTFAYFSLRAGVPISDLAREMGHTDVSRTYRSYGQWCAEQGERAASIRGAWAKGQAEVTEALPHPPQARS